MYNVANGMFYFLFVSLLTHTQTIIIAFLRDTGSIHGRPDPFSLFALEGAGHETSGCPSRPVRTVL